MNKKRVIIIILVLAALTAGIWWFWKREREPVSTIEFPGVGSVAKDFKLPNMVDGDKTVSLAQFRGKKAVFMNFWASWSPFSKDEMKDLATIQNEFSSDLEVLAINRAEDQPTAERYAKGLNAFGPYPLLLDSTDEVWKLYKGFAMPTSIFIDRSGIIREVKFGPLTLEEMRERIKRVLSSPSH